MVIKEIDIKHLAVFFLPVLFLAGCNHFDNSIQEELSESEIVWYDFEIINKYPHDPEAFTQGLLYRDGYLYEGTGRRGQSSIRKVDLETGEILQIHELGDEFFGEGLTVLNNRLIQLTLSSNIGFVYDIETFSLVDTFKYDGYGWGLANDGKRLIMSDGSSELRFLDSNTFQELGRVTVKEHGKPVDNINEMEMMDGVLLANILHTNHIAIISPETGEIVGRVDLDDLSKQVRENHASVNVLNGIAYDEVNDRLFVTGKLWPYLFEIRFFLKE
jgi:glutaminyl-peptide cyclotransferase